MATSTIDTLAISGKLRAAGFTEEQAAAQVEALQEATEEATDDLVTGRDMHHAIRELELRLKAELAQMEARMAQMEARMLRHIILAICGSMTAQTAVFAAIVKFF